MQTEPTSQSHPRKKSAMVTVSGLLILVPGLLFAIGVVTNGLLLLKGPPPTGSLGQYGLREGVQTYVMGYRMASFLFYLAGFLLLFPAGLTVLRRWRHARVHASIVVAAVLGLQAWAFISAAKDSIQPAQVIVAIFWIAWAAFILVSLWRSASAADFSRSADDDGS